MKRNLILIIIFIILLIPMIFYKKENVIKDLTFTQIEDKSTPLNYKKEYTFTIKELSSKKSSLEFTTKNHYVEIYINDKKIYELKEDRKIKKDNLIKIPLTKKYIDKEIKIILIPLTEKNIDNNLDLNIK